MVQSIVLSLVDQVRIVVPDSLNLITPYVLTEQQDWFEDEIKFLRLALRPGQRVIDIGANYGVYTLCMAKTVGPAGHVWAFEPATTTAALLAESIAENGFNQVTLVRCALSQSEGYAELSVSSHSELNSLVHNGSDGSAHETVALTTLDAGLTAHDWTDIDFVKIDAEGEESNILRGAQKFCSELSPLIQYEVKAGTEWHLELVNEFAALGYDSYRLVPGLNLLIPFDGSAPDGFLLNLFCCKPDRAALLSSWGLLATREALRQARKSSDDPSIGDAPADKYHWRQALPARTYAGPLLGGWDRASSSAFGSGLELALGLQEASRDPTFPAADRVVALERAVRILTTLCASAPTTTRLSTLARMTHEWGARSASITALLNLFTKADADARKDDAFREPFLPPGLRFESVTAVGAFQSWMMAAALEQFEHHCAFSSFYTGASAKPRLEAIRDLGFGSPEMGRRLRLVQLRHG